MTRLFAVALLLAVGCGDDDGESTSAPTETRTTAPQSGDGDGDGDGDGHGDGHGDRDGDGDGAPELDEVAHATYMHAPDEDAPPGDAADDEAGIAGLVRAHRTRMRDARAAPVHVLSTRDAERAGRELCDAVVPRRPASTPVLIKPNLAGINLLRPHRLDDGIALRTTGVDFLRGIVRCLKARGHQEISIIEGWSRPEQLEDWQRATGLDRLLEEEGVRYFGLYDDRGPGGDEEPTLAAPNPNAVRLRSGLRIPRVLARHLRDGLFISVPRMKMHRFAVMTLSIKNNMGLVVSEGAEAPRSGAGAMHRELGPWLHRFREEHEDDRDAYVTALEAFSERIVDMLEIATPDAVLIDGIPPVAGDGFALIEPHDEGVAIGSTNPVFADAVALEYMGLLDNADLEREIRHRTSPLVEEAARRFWGSTDVLDGIRIVGDDSFRRRSPRRVAHYRAMPGFEIGHAPSPMGALPWLENAMTAPRATTAPTVDGLLDDPAWGAAPLVTIRTDYRGRPAGPETSARALWTPEALYFAFECAFDTLNVDTEAPTSEEHPALYRFDAIEVFLDHTPRSRATYREYEFGPRGHFMDIDVDRRRRPRGDVEFTSGLELATRVDETAKRFTIEVRIPAAAFDRPALGPTNMKLNLYRIAGEGQGRVHMARYPTYTERPNYHVPERFGWLRLTR